MTRELALLAPSCCFMVRALFLPCRCWQAFGLWCVVFLLCYLGKRSIAWFMIVRNFSMFLRGQSIDVVGVISSLNFVFFFFFFSQLHIFCYFFWFNLFPYILRPHTGSCVLLPMCFGGWARNSVPQWHRPVSIAYSCFWCWSTYILLYSLPWRRASNAVCPVELVLIPPSLVMPFLSLHLTPSLCHLELISFTYSFLI